MLLSSLLSVVWGLSTSLGSHEVMSAQEAAKKPPLVHDTACIASDIVLGFSIASCH